MRDLILLRGAPGSGKSTFVRDNHLEPYTLSSDAVRLMFSCPEFDALTGEPHISQRNEHAVWEFIEQTAELRMKMGQFLVLDAQNIAPERWMDMAEKYRYRVWKKTMDATLEECLERNAARPVLQQVPEHVIRASVWRIDQHKLSNRIKEVTDEVVRGDLSPKNVDNYKRLFFIGDIHSCYTALQSFFDHIHGPREDDLYVFVGDYLDRGLEHKETLEFLVSHRLDWNFMFLTGNHIHESLWAQDRVDEIRSREFLHNTMPALADVDKKPVREWCSRWSQLAYLEFHGKRYFVTHAGIGFMPEHIRFIPSQTYIRGGAYEEDIDRAWCEKCYGADLIQIHGHRNWYSYAIDETETSINLNSAIEFGEPLRVYGVDADNTYYLQFDNPVHRSGMTLRRRADIMEGKDVGTPQERTELLVYNLQAAKGIAEKQLDNNISSFNFTRDVFYSMAWDDLNKIARGLFIDTAHWKILARGYEKFFNLNEHKLFNTPDWLKEHLVFPIKCYRKYNGFLGLMSWNPYTKSLFYASKSTNEGPHAQLVKEIIEKQLTPIQLETITRYLQDNDVTLLWEILTPRDPHIIKYDKEEAILLDIVYNTINFKKKDWQTFKAVAENVFGVPHKQLDKELSTWWYMDHLRVLETNWLGDFTVEAVEGWVIEDEKGYQFKLKSGYYDNWKRLRKAKELLTEGNTEAMSHFRFDDIASDIIDFMQEFTTDELQQLSIIDIRDRYLEMGGLDYPYNLPRQERKPQHETPPTTTGEQPK